MQQLNPDRKKFLGGAISHSMHQDSIFKKYPVPLFSSHGGNVHWASFMIVFDSCEESLIIVRQEARVGERIFSQHMVSKQNLMKEVVYEVGIGSCLHK